MKKAPPPEHDGWITAGTLRRNLLRLSPEDRARVLGGEKQARSIMRKLGAAQFRMRCYYQLAVTNVTLRGNRG